MPGSDQSPLGSNEQVASQGLSRRSFLKFIGASLLVSGLSSTMTGDAELPEERRLRENMNQYQFLINEPTKIEINELTSKLQAEIEEPFTVESEEYIKGEFVFTVITTTGKDENISKTILVRKKNIPVNSVTIYFHSIDGANKDVGDYFGSDFEEIWNSGGAIIFPLTKSYIRSTEETDFFTIKSETGELIDLTQIGQRFEANSPVRTLRGISSAYSLYPELQNVDTDLAGISMGGSTGIAALTMWNAFASKGYVLPKLRQASLFAPISNLFEKSILRECLRESPHPSLGPHLIQRDLIGAAIMDYKGDLEARFQFKNVLITPEISVYFPPNESLLKINQAIVLYDIKKLPPQIIAVIPPLQDKDKKRKILMEMRAIYWREDLYNAADTGKTSERLRVLTEDLKADGISKFRQYLMYFSPKYLLRSMKEMGQTLPVTDINVLYASMDRVVPPQFSKDLITDLKKNGINVGVDILVGGHILNEQAISKRLLSHLRDPSNYRKEPKSLRRRDLFRSVLRT